MKDYISLKNNNFLIKIDKESGAVRHIFDKTRMDWVLQGANWGYVKILL